MADDIAQLYGHHGNEPHAFDVVNERDEPVRRATRGGAGAGTGASTVSTPPTVETTVWARAVQTAVAGSRVGEVSTT